MMLRAELFTVPLPLKTPFETSSHRKTELTHVLIRLEDELGMVGWGEIASPSQPLYGAETTATCESITATALLPRLLGRELGAPAAAPAAAAAAWGMVRGNNFAKAGVESAVWDLCGKRAGRSLAALLGGTATVVTAGVSLGIDRSLDRLCATVAEHVAEGYRRIKLKIAPGWDVQPVRAVRERFGEVLLQVDANGAYRAEPEHVAALTELDRLGLAMIEQPFAPDALLDSARLQQRLHTPICLDESVTSLGELRTALHLDAGRILNIKVSRLGGLTASKAAHDECRAAQVPVWCGGMHEFGVGRAANLAIAALPGFVLPSDVSASSKYYARDVLTQHIEARCGQVAVPQHPGIGVMVDEDFVRSIATRHRLFTAKDAA